MPDTVWVHEMRDDWVLGVYATLEVAVRELGLAEYEIVDDDEPGEDGILHHVRSPQLGHAELSEIEVKS